MKTSGFTMIEMLVTLTLFAVCLTSLLAGLASGAKMWQTSKRHQITSADFERTLRIVREDIAHIVSIIDDEPAIVESNSDTSREVISFSRLASRSDQRYVARSQWSGIEYFVAEDEETQEQNWMRRESPHVAQSMLHGADGEVVLLKGIESIRFDYWNGTEYIGTWDDPQQLPLQIRVTASSASGKRSTLSATVGLGLMGGRAR